MIQNFMKKLSVISLSIILAGSFLTACDSGNKSGGAESGAETIRIGTGNAYKPYCYVDEDGNLAGYEYEVLKAIDEFLPQYEFIYEQFDFKNILLSIDSGKIDIGAHQFEINEDRKANYLFGNESYTTYIRYIVVAKDRNDITTLDDLVGKKVMGTSGDNATYLFEQYNKEHPDGKIDLEVVDTITNEERIAGITKGKWDSFSLTNRDVQARNEEFGDVIKTVGEPILTSDTFFVFKKGNTQLQEAVDGALKALKENGRLSQISVDAIGADYTVNE